MNDLALCLKQQNRIGHPSQLLHLGFASIVPRDLQEEDFHRIALSDRTCSATTVKVRCYADPCTGYSRKHHSYRMQAIFWTEVAQASQLKAYLRKHGHRMNQRSTQHCWMCYQWNYLKSVVTYLKYFEIIFVHMEKMHNGEVKEGLSFAVFLVRNMLWGQTK